MKYLPITILFLIINLQVNSQQTWSNYTNDFIIYDIEIDGNDVWIGSQGGLTKTNLETGAFETFLAGNSPIKGGGITEIEKAPDGSFWFGSYNAGVFHYNNGEWTNYFDGIIKEHWHKISHLQILANGDVWFFVDEGNQKKSLFRIREGIVESFPNIPDRQLSFCVTDENTIYISYNQAIYKYDVGQKAIVETLHVDNSIITSDDKFTEIVADKNGGVIISSPTRILSLKGGNLSVLEEVGLYVYQTFQDDNGNNYLQPYSDDENGIRLIKYDGNEVTYYKDEDFGTYPADRTPIFYAADSEGGLYGSFYTEVNNFKIYRFAEAEWMPVESQIFPVSDNYQNSVTPDCEGNLWFNGRHGIDVRYVDGSWGHFAIETQLYSTFAASNITVDPTTCDVWIANSGNNGNSTVPGIIRISNGEVTEFMYDHDNVSDIEATVDGKVYFYSFVSGFGYIENDEVVLIDEFDQFASIFSLASDSKGNVYIASWELGLIKYDGETFTYLGTNEEYNRAYRVFVDNDDFVWIDTPSGIMQFDGVNWHSFEAFEFHLDVFGMVQDKKGNYWLSTWNDGLIYWDKENFQRYDIHNSGLSSNKLRHVALDPQGNLIVSQHIGASVLSIPDTQRNFKGSGTVFYDSDKNGSFEEGIDVLVPGQKVKAAELNTWSITNLNGQYTFYSNEVNEENFEHEIEESAVSTTDNPQLASIFDNHSVLPDFGYWKELKEDVVITLTSGIPVCNRDFKVQISLRNRDVGEVNGRVILKHDNTLTVLDSSIPISQQSDDEIIYEDFTLGTFSGKSIQITFEAPGIEVEETFLSFEAIFETADNQFSTNTSDQVLCSFDPNDKKVEATGDFKNDFGLTKDPIRYTIRFQNEGTYKAFDIAVTDTLDSNLDPSTFEFLASSHRVEATISEEGIVNFNFPNIDLPPKDEDDLGSQGFVSFTVKPYSNTALFVKIYNTASIYFDFNPPIVTNTTKWNVVDDLSLVGTQELESRIQVYPNPSNGLIQINLEENSTFRIMDVSGKMVDRGIFSIGLNTLKLQVNPGVYLLHVDGASGALETMRLVVF